MKIKLYRIIFCKHFSLPETIVDVFIRKGCRFKGIGNVLSEGSLFEEIVSFYKNTDASVQLRNCLNKSRRVIPLLSPVYDTDVSEEK